MPVHGGPLGPEPPAEQAQAFTDDHDRTNDWPVSTVAGFADKFTEGGPAAVTGVSRKACEAPVAVTVPFATIRPAVLIARASVSVLASAT